VILGQQAAGDAAAAAESAASFDDVDVELLIEGKQGLRSCSPSAA